MAVSFFEFQDLEGLQLMDFVRDFSQSCLFLGVTKNE